MVGVDAQRTDWVGAAGRTAAEPQGVDDPGQPSAIDWFLQRTELSSYDAAALVDADNLADSLHLREMNRQLESGARVLESYDGARIRMTRS